MHLVPNAVTCLRSRVSALFVSSLVLAAVMTIAGCAHPQPQQQAQLTPGQQQAIADALVNRIRTAGQLPSKAIATPVAPQAASLPAISESQLAAVIAAWPSLQTGVSVEDRADGFTVNGARYVDPEGPIVRYSADTVTGNITYLARIDHDIYAIKSMRALTNQPPLKIATASLRAGVWQVQTGTGLMVSGHVLFTNSSGFTVVRDGAGFIYSAGQGLTNFVAPDTYDVAMFQHGDVMGTGYVLLEKRQSAGTGGLLSSVTALGSSLGLAEKADYALYNVKTGRVVPLNIAIDGKDVGLYGNCRKKNSFVNECADVQFVSSLYDKNGSKNLGHYFWRVYWFRTNGDPLVVYQENSLQDITAMDVETGKKVSVFHRTLGIAGFFPKQGIDGRVAISAQLGFSTETVDDAQTVLERSGST